MGQTPSIPRKGTETIMVVVEQKHFDFVKHPQFPARGRKLQSHSDEPDEAVTSNTLNSPQGDGNPLGKGPVGTAPIGVCPVASYDQGGRKPFG